MIKAIIIDDESLAREVIKEYLMDYPEVEVVQECIDGFEGIKAISFHKPDLIFLDIQMPKINGFEMLELIDDSPVVIFTTAFDEYAIKAFTVNSIDYLLKPIEKEALERSLKKFKSGIQKEIPDLKNILSELISTKNNFRERFLVKKGDSLFPLLTNDVAYFYAEEKVVFAKIKSNQRYIIDFTLDSLETTLNPEIFYRANRKILLSIECVKQIKNSFNGKLKAFVNPASEEEIIISREKAQHFKNWLGRK